MTKLFFLTDEYTMEMISLLAFNQEGHEGHCTAWGSFHVRNFDGTIMSLNGGCSYILAKSSGNILMEIVSTRLTSL